MSKLVRKRKMHGGRRPGAGRKEGSGRKTSLKVSVHRGVLQAALSRLPLLSMSKSGYVEAALIAKLRADGVDVERIIRESSGPVTAP